MLNPLLDLFQFLYKDFPAHLHINLTAESRGLGIGSLLLQTIEFSLKKIGIDGLHLITTPSAPNRIFYQKNGYNIEHAVSFKGSDCLFMGKKI